MNFFLLISKDNLMHDYIVYKNGKVIDNFKSNLPYLKGDVFQVGNVDHRVIDVDYIENDILLTVEKA